MNTCSLWPRFALLSLLLLPGCATERPETGISEETVSRNILGTAYLGQQKWTEAEDSFREASLLSPEEPLLLNNTSVALVQQGRIDEAELLLQQSIGLDATNPFAHYNLGLIEKNRGDFEAAAGHFEIVATHDPDDLLTQYNLGIVLSRIGRDDEAETAFRRVLQDNPAHVSSLYGLGRFLLQRGDQEEGARLIALSQEIRSRSGLDEAVGSQYGEQGPYAMGVDFPGNVLPAPAKVDVSFQATTRLAAADPSAPAETAWAVTRLGSGGELVAMVAAGGQVYSVGPQGAPEIEALSLGDGGRYVALAAGDANNDGIVDLAALVERDGVLGAFLTLQDDAGVFAPPGGFTGSETDSGEGAAGDLTFVDQDHDGDLDLFWCWSSSSGAGCRIAVNDGAAGLAADPIAAHGISIAGHGAVQVAFSDFDNDRDIDLLVAGPEGVEVFSNQRDGSFARVSGEVGLGPATAGAARMALVDLDKDGWMDLLTGGENGVQLFGNRRSHFSSLISLGPASAGSRLVALDYDNDGFIDVARSTEERGTVLIRNTGAGNFEEQPGLPVDLGAPLAGFDADGDGDLELLTLDAEGTVVLGSNEGGNRNHWISVDPEGVGDNRFGIGAKAEILAGALRQKTEVTEPVPLHFGLGDREAVESVRFLWPGGVLQDEVTQPAGERVAITQLDRKGTSCPLLYAWNGGEWRFVTDFLGGAAIGNLHAPGVYGVPDTDEYIRLPDGLTPDEAGRLRVRMNNQLEEVLWFDSAELIVVDHPAGTEVYPNERLMPGPPWPEFRLFASKTIRPLVGARNLADGSDLSGVLRESDRSYAEGFELLPFKGYAESHSIELDLGPVVDGEQVVLLLDGWIDYADSSSNLAASQAGVALVPPRLRVSDGRGGWRETDHVMGFPAGLPKTMSVDLTGQIPGGDAKIRIETNMRIYWDRVRVMLGGEETKLAVQRLKPLSAEMRFGGFPHEISPDGKKPHNYDPTRTSEYRSWKAHVGAYTAFGEVTELLSGIDDRFVTTRNGDEIELSFAAPPPPASGWTRTYLVFADGFGKDMDPNSAANNTVEPIPFHGMPGYPYGPEAMHPAVALQGPPYRWVPPSNSGWPGAQPQALAAVRD